MTEEQRATEALFAGAGDARARCRAVDWGATQLGPVTGWGPGLRTAVQICLDARSAMAVWAGPELVLVHNDAYGPILGAKVGWAMGRPIRDVWSEVWELIAGDFRSVIETGASVRHDNARFPLLRNGREEVAFFVYGLTAIREGDGRIVGAFNVVEETTSAVRERSESEHRYRTLFETIHEGFCIIEVILDAEGRGVDYRFVEANPAFEQHTGLRNAIGRTARELVPDLEPLWAATYGRIVATGKPERFIDHSDALGRWFEVDAFRLGAPEGRRVALLFRDISERKRAEEAIEQSRARLEETDRRKNQFLAVLSHELRNPLTPVRNSLYLLNRVPPGGEQARRALAVIERQIEQLVHLVDDLLDVTRITRDKIQLQRQRLELNDLVARTLDDHRALFEQAGIEAQLEPAAEPVLVDADGSRLAQLIGNLLQNAAKFTPAGGRVTLFVSSNSATGSALIRVVDTGVGMPAEVLAHLFEPFMQADTTLDRSQGGLGLGLALVKGLAALHGGTVEAKSDGPGRGAELLVHLPLDSSVAAAPEREQPACAALHRRVLVIEDNVDAAESLRETLELQGHAVAVAYSGPDGVARARQFLPEVVLCDIGLPGMDGYAVARALRADATMRGAHLIALTGYALPEDVQRAQAAGFEQHLAKPASPERLEGVLAGIRI